MRGHMFLPGFGMELVFTLVIVTLCLLVYLSTRELYSLSRHKGIEVFRNTFLFFGLAYASRLVLHMVLIGSFAFDIFLCRRDFMQLGVVLVTYFSTLAIMYLIYSGIWKKLRFEYFVIGANFIALLASLAAFLFRNHLITVIVQVGLLVFAVYVMIRTRYKKMQALYGLILVFWIIGLYTIGPKMIRIPFEVNIMLQVASIGVFVAIYVKVSKWLR